MPFFSFWNGRKEGEEVLGKHSRRDMSLLHPYLLLLLLLFLLAVPSMMSTLFFQRIFLLIRSVVHRPRERNSVVAIAAAGGV